MLNQRGAVPESIIDKIVEDSYVEEKRRKLSDQNSDEKLQQKQTVLSSSGSGISTESGNLKRKIPGDNNNTDNKSSLSENGNVKKAKTD